jgi:adenosylcobinamide-GDP ribazoletransferase
MPEFSPRPTAAGWRQLCLAATFLTRLPLGAAPDAAFGALAEAAWAFPLVGAVIGGLCALAYAVAGWIGIPVLPAALIAVGAGVALTGALHEDGLADTADGLGGGRDREAKLAIMRDSRSGAYGVLALVFSVGLRAASLAAIAADGRVAAALIAAHAAARGVLPLVLRGLPPARADGLGAAAGRPEPGAAWTAAGLGALVALIALGLLPGIAALLCAGAAAAALAGLARRQLGGYTGDVLGAIEQGSEIIIMLAAAAWAS